MSFKLENKNILIGISCIPKCYDENFIDTIFRTIKEQKAQNVLVMYADTLQRYSYMSNQDMQEDRALEKSLKNGYIMRDLLLKGSSKYFDEIEIINWECHLHHHGQATQLFSLMYEKIASFRDLIDKIVLSFYNKRYPPVESAQNIRRRKFKNLQLYVLEEILSFSKVHEYNNILYDNLVYPVNETDIEETIKIHNFLSNEFNFIMETEIIPCLLKEKSILNSEINKELEKLTENVKNKIFRGERSTFSVMSNLGKLIPCEDKEP